MRIQVFSQIQTFDRNDVRKVVTSLQYMRFRVVFTIYKHIEINTGEAEGWLLQTIDALLQTSGALLQTLMRLFHTFTYLLQTRALTPTPIPRRSFIFFTTQKRADRSQLSHCLFN